MQEKMAKYLVDCFGDQLLIDPLPQYPVKIDSRKFLIKLKISKNFIIFPVETCCETSITGRSKI